MSMKQCSPDLYFFVRVHRYIELTNGLRALLISDLSRTSEPAEETDEDEEESVEDDDGDSGEGLSSEEGGCSVDTSEEQRPKCGDAKSGSSEKQVSSFSDPLFTWLWVAYCQKLRTKHFISRCLFP